MQGQKKSGTAMKFIITVLVYVLAAAAGCFITADDPFSLPLLPFGGDQESVISGEEPGKEPAGEEKQEETGEKDGKKAEKKTEKERREAEKKKGEELMALAEEDP